MATCTAARCSTAATSARRVEKAAVRYDPAPAGAATTSVRARRPGWAGPTMA